MAHQVETMAYAGQLPWHGLGVKVIDDLSPEQMMQKAGVDWTVEKQDMITSGGSTVKSKQALVRSSDGEVLDVVGKGWNPVQNADAFNFFEEYVRAGEMQMHTAGSLNDGKMVWALAKTNESFELFNGDVTENYFLFSNPHEFGKAIDIRMTPIRVVCNNTLTLSLSQDSNAMLKVNHRKAFDVAEVKEQMGIAKEKMEQYKSMAEFLGSKKYTSENIVQYFNTVFGSPAKEKVDGVFPTTSLNAKLALENLDTQPGAKFAQGTFWNAFNTVTYLNDHVQGRTTDGRLTSSWYGRNRRVKLKALDTALEMAEAA